MAKILVVGGAGYVGSATVLALVDAGHEVTVLDNLSTGHPELIHSKFWVHGDLGDRALLRAVFSAQKFDVVFHFAAKTIVSESVEQPDLYVENNVTKTKVLLQEMITAGIHKFVFSSTCAIFGEPQSEFVHEDLPKNPLNPYGATKLAVESMLEGEFAMQGMHSIALRYFNASGAEQDTRAGEWHEPETHLIPRVIQRAIQGQDIELFGDDYPSVDGTCVRDYIHVSDLATAHIAAMDLLLQQKTQSTGSFDGINVGTGQGATVLNVIQAVAKALNKKLVPKVFPRRAGDAARLVADVKQAREKLNFFPKHDLESIVQSALQWEVKRAQFKRKVVFFDRDGTFNPDPGYIGHPDLFGFYKGVPESLHALKKQGWLTALISNQSGVGRGLFSLQDLSSINIKMQSDLAQANTRIDFIENCIHSPGENCNCRKPKPFLIQKVLKKLNIQASDCVFVGDRESDILAAKNAGILKVYLVRTGDGQKTAEKTLAEKPSNHVIVVDDVNAAIGDILKTTAQNKT